MDILTYQTRYFLEGLFLSYRDQMSMRKMKLIVREASDVYKLMQADGRAVNWQVVLCIQAAKHIHDPSLRAQDAVERPSYYEYFKSHRCIEYHNFFAETLTAIGDGRKQDFNPVPSGIEGVINNYLSGRQIHITNNPSEDGKPQMYLINANAGKMHSNVKVVLPEYYFNY